MDVAWNFHTKKKKKEPELDRRVQGGLRLGEDDPLEDVYEHLYWKSGATDIKTGEKTNYNKKIAHIIVRCYA